ncbi:hypothetical protein ANN_10498 [Periplaneta americana]|uniref:Reverse transcriptase domain-containing protein n=1 Tax=Periplaneta americana TaxID=6978 RepID=A0ABQ8TPF8_PERAM|nr:hypothetical protein ANN_10498 [Periplaneta americana]
MSLADDVNMLGENPQTIRENTEILLEARKAIGLEVNPQNTNYMIMSRDQNIVRNGIIKIGDLSFEEVEKFKYLGATVTNINDTREEIKRRINMGNACYCSSLLSKNVKVRIYKTVLLPVVLYGCETWTLTLREEQRLRVFENKVLRKISGAKMDEVTGEWRKLHNAELHALYSSPDKIRNIKSRRFRWAGHVARMGESRNTYRVFKSEHGQNLNLIKSRCGHIEDAPVVSRVISTAYFYKNISCVLVHLVKLQKTAFVTQQQYADLHLQCSERQHVELKTRVQIPVPERIFLRSTHPTRSGFIIDSTVRFETNEEQPAEVDKEKKNIYNPTIPYYLQKYQLEELEVIGLLVGARDNATIFMKDVFKRLGIRTSIIPIVTLAALKGSIALLKHHLYSK